MNVYVFCYTADKPCTGKPAAPPVELLQAGVKHYWSVPNYTDIFVDFVCGIGSYVKGLPKTQRCKSYGFISAYMLNG